MNGTGTRGRPEGEVRTLRVGDGPSPLVVVPGFEDVLAGDVGLVGRRLAALRYRRYTDTHTVYLARWPRGLPPRTRVEDVVGQYAAVVDDAGGRADVLGHSAGGFVAAELAFRFPERVDHLVLAGAGYRLGEGGRRAVGRWRDLAATGEARALRRAVAATTHAGLDQRVRPAVAGLRARLGTPEGAPADAATVAAALLSYDRYRGLPRLRPPTLVVGGTRDALFPAPLLRETADRLPHGSVHLFEGAGNAVRTGRTRAFDRVVTRFLADMADVDRRERDRRRWTPAGD
jgi:pimeloyl-ACP methyl ester carboxylesterase